MKRNPKSERLTYVLDIVEKRNDGWLNSHIRPVIEVWQANVDFQLVIDSGKITSYMTKYVTKAEPNLTRKSMKTAAAAILDKCIEEGLPAVVALKRIMTRLLGTRVRCQQEMVHLSLSLPIVSCSHSFKHISLEKELLLFCPPSLQ